MKITALRSVSLTLCVLVVLVAWHKYRSVLFPAEITLYVLDSREGGDFAEEFKSLFPRAKQRRAGLRIIIKSIDRSVLNTTEAQWRKALEVAANSSGTSPVFFEVGWPNMEGMKLLRAEIEMRSAVAERTNLLGRTIALVGVRGESSSQACRQLEDDWRYLDWNFGGIALIVDDAALALIGPCLPGVLTKVLGRAP